MMEVIHRPGIVMLAAVLVLVAIGGCSRPPDERLAEMAQQTMAEQSRQNQRMADQSEAIVEESHQLAEAAKALVEQDAEARRELIAAQQDLTTQLHNQQTTIDAGRNQLEQDRREIAHQRHRDPIIAAVIQNFGLVIACLLPLMVSVLVIRQMQWQEPDHAAVAELLTLELTSETPLLLPGPPTRHRASSPDDDVNDLALIAGDSPDDAEPPF